MYVDFTNVHHKGQLSPQISKFILLIELQATLTLDNWNDVAHKYKDTSNTSQIP